MYRIPQVLRSLCKTSWECVPYGAQTSLWIWLISSLLNNPSHQSSTDDTCLACKKRGHHIHTCILKGWIFADRIRVAWEQGFCKNCLRKGHIAVKYQAPLKWKKCTKHHHMLLHQDANYPSQRKSEEEDCKEENSCSGTNQWDTSLTVCIILLFIQVVSFVHIRTRSWNAYSYATLYL